MMSKLRRSASMIGAALLVSGAGMSAFADDAPAPKTVAILIFKGVQIIDYSGPYEVFADVGYDVFTVGATKDPVTTAGGDGQTITPKYTFADAPMADIVLIPGGGGPHAAPGETPAVLDWIRSEALHAQRVMSVCSGAFTLANTGLLDGLNATTTAGYIADLQGQHPAIKVVRDQRVVDNGKLITTAGLSAGIDGALHVIEVMDGHDLAQTVSLGIEYDWRPQGGYVRAAMADRMNPDPNLDAAGDLVDQRFNGDNDHWELTDWISTKLSAIELFGAVKTAYAKGYAAEGPWAPGSVQVADAGPLAAAWRFDDQQGRHWRGALTVEPVPGVAQKFLVRLTTDRIG